MAVGKSIVGFYSERIEMECLLPLQAEAEKRGFSFRLSKDPTEKVEIGLYTMHRCYKYAKNAKLSAIMLHDMAQGHDFWPNMWQSEPWDLFDIGFLPNIEWQERWEGVKHLPEANPQKGMYVVGWPKADIIENNKPVFEAAMRKLRAKLSLPFEKTVLYAPSWENDGKMHELVTALQNLPVNVLIKYAPSEPDIFPDQVVNMKAMLDLVPGYGAQVSVINPKESIMNCLPLADIVVSDESNVMVEALLFGIPSIMVTDWDIVFRDQRRKVLFPFEFPYRTVKADLAQQVQSLLADKAEHTQRMQAHKGRFFHNLGNSCKTILDVLEAALHAKNM